MSEQPTFHLTTVDQLREAAEAHARALDRYIDDANERIQLAQATRRVVAEPHGIDRPASGGVFAKAAASARRAEFEGEGGDQNGKMVPRHLPRAVGAE